MAYSDAHNVQFLDLTGVDEDEKKKILTSLQIRDSTVKGPWNKLDSIHGIHEDHTNQNINSQRNYDHYPPATSVLVRPHINTLPPTAHHIPPAAVYPRPYQQPIPVYPPAFVPPVQYQPPIVAPVVPVVNTIVPINSPIIPVPPIVNNPYPPQQITYPSYHIPPHNPVPAPVNNYIPPMVQQVHHVTNEVDQSNDHKVVENNVAVATNDCAEAENKQVAVEIKSNGNEGKSWASLFNKKGGSVEVGRSNGDHSNKSAPVASPFIQNSAKNPIDLNNVDKSMLNDFDDPNYYRMGEILINYSLDNRITSLQPRGLINHSNYCYINSILQAMLACPPVYNLLRSMGEKKNVKENRKHTQIIDNMVKFVNEFHPLPPGQRVNRRSDNKLQKKDPPLSVNCDRPFEPYWIYKMLNGIRSDSFVVEGRQEDAEEFLGCLLNGLNDEMLELMKLVEDTSGQVPVENNEESDGGDGDKEWQVIGPKNKGCVTRRTEIVRTPISDIFGGNIRSRLSRAGDQITDNIQPFFTLQLNIEKANTVREALEALVCKNQLEGVTSSKTNEEVEAWQQVTIEELPVVLILHLKCFDFKLDGCTKIIKALEFPVDLKIDSKLLSSKTNYQAKEKQYKLFAVVYHDGKEATKGHYVTDAYHVGYASWIRYDDTSVKAVKEEDVLKPHGTRVPYLLFYRRSDTVRGK